MAGRVLGRGGPSQVVVHKVSLEAGLAGINHDIDYIPL